MALISVRGLRKTYHSEGKAVEAVRDLSFDTVAGQFMTILGASGCGKSTTLRCIAGLEQPDAGEIWIADRLVFSSADRVNLSPAKRGIGMVFQSYAIWPHMSVSENVAYPLQRQHVHRAERKKRVQHVLDMVDLIDEADRPAPSLSGGQQQRVALARALVAEPQVLLLDEPLSNLDARLRRELRGYLRKIQTELGLTVLYVTHDQAEAMAMSDVVTLLDKGTIIEWGSPQHIYQRPSTEFGARFVGDANIFDGVVDRVEEGWLAINAAFGELTVSIEAGDTDRTDSIYVPGTAVVLMIRLEDIKVQATGSNTRVPGASVFPGIVRTATFLGADQELEVEMRNGSAMHVRTSGRVPVSPGDDVDVELLPERVALLGRDPHASIVGPVQEVSGDSSIPSLKS